MGGWVDDVQPIYNAVMRQREDELVHDAIHAHGPTDQLQRRVVRVAVDEALAVEARQRGAAHAARQHGHVVHVRLVDHGAHRLRDGPRRELVRRVLVPDRLEVEDRAPEVRSQEREAPRVAHAGRGVVERVRGGQHERGGFGGRVVVLPCAWAHVRAWVC